MSVRIQIAFALILNLISQINSQTALYIPDTLSGTNFSLTVQTGTKQFIGSNNTPTYGYNGNFLGPTLIINKGDSITFNVKNTLTQATTVHWHGFHVAPKNDGGPHQIINAGATWSPSFKMRNEASTFWYHPHGTGKTEIQISKGLAGMIIVRDSTERSYTLPRRYNVDDFPLIVQSRVFDVFYQVSTATHEDSINMVNGTIKPFLQVPKQVVRLRLLNAAADRTYNFGLSDNSSFYLIASDGGLLSQPYQTNRVRLSTGERVEILVDFNNYNIGQQLYLKSYASELPKGIIGADSVGTANIAISEGYYSNPLNGVNFNVLRFDVIAQALNPVTIIPTAFSPKVPLLEAGTNAYRKIKFTPDTVTSGQQGKVDGPFLMNNKPFNMDSINVKTFLNKKEVWTLVNKTMVAHPFHIHDIQFFILDINGNLPPLQYQGLKDVILVQPNDSIRFIAKFTTFADNNVPYMYHCHLLHHEDDGMMGTFLVQDPNTIGIKESNINQELLEIFPNPSNEKIILKITNEYQHESIESISIYNSLGMLILIYDSIKSDQHEINVSSLPVGFYTLKVKVRGQDLKIKFVKE
ncbi:MAG: multicopper oxidase domain-containing protein [Bacteroidetes bacterium]|nr:multicopper oxidase domain-containing protein [Bacteroidota bacterium]